MEIMLTLRRAGMFIISDDDITNTDDFVLEVVCTVQPIKHNII